MVYTTEQNHAERYRQFLKKLLESAEFGNSRQARDFLNYVAEAALEGRSKLGQTEIAERALKRGNDFNPLDDASVRKIATLTRQKLEKYYATEGRADAVLVSLPLRSYVPLFRFRSSDELNGGLEVGIPLPVVASGDAAGSRATVMYRVIGAIIVLILAIAALFGTSRLPAFGDGGGLEIKTQRGDIMHEINDVPGDGIRIGPAISTVDEVSVRMKFSPEAASQQGGLMIFENPDRYVKLGRQFTSRSQWEFGLETKGHYQKPVGTFSYDPSGQDGTSVWLSIRRNHTIFEGFVSADGVNWRKIGNTLEMPDPMPNARIAVYGYNGRTNAPPAIAKFWDPRVGPVFQNWPAGAEAGSPIEGWAAASTCGDELGTPLFTARSLDFLFRNEPRKRCDWTLTRPVPSGDWGIETRLDFQFHNSAIAGLIVSGKGAYLRLIRWGINNGSITSEHFGHDQVSRPDFPGNPPITLRIQCKAGVLRSSFSRDDSEFIEVANEVKLESLGPDPRFGIHTGVSSWVGAEPPPPAHFFYVRQLVSSWAPYR